MRVVRFHAAALAELNAALDWYSARSPAAAGLFADLVEEVVMELPDMPEASPAWPGRTDVRVRRIGRFPFSVIYRITDSEIRIAAVAHARRRPGYWMHRLGR